MSLTSSQLQQLAKLAHLDLPDQDVAQLGEKLNAIVDFFETLNEVDTSDVVAMAHPLEMTQRLRPDEVTETNQRDKFQQSATAIEDGLYLVPKVIE